MFHLVVFLMMFFHRHAKIDRRQEGEDKGLDESHQQFEKHHEHIEQDGYDGYTITQCRGHLAKNVYQADETHRNDVAGGDVGKKSDHQHKGLGKYANDFYQGDNGQRGQF